MKRFTAALIGGVAWLSACVGPGNRNESSPSEEYAGADTVAMTAEEEDNYENLLFPDGGEEAPLSKNLDELFDDFIFAFDENRHLQRERVEFPLPVVGIDGDTVYVARDEWRHESLFAGKDFYTVLYADEEQMEMQKDSGCTFVNVQWIYLKDQVIRNCHFARPDGKWRLKAVVSERFDGSEIADFLGFYRSFSSDSVFLVKHLARPLRYVTQDSENDMGIIEGTLEPEQWQAFNPVIPADTITNIVYGQSYRNMRKIIMTKCGISNGMMDLFVFEKKGSNWKLVGFEN